MGLVLWGGYLANKSPRLYLLSIGKEKECYQMGNAHNETWKWNLAWRRTLFKWEDEAVMELHKMIEDVKISLSYPDKWEWVHNKDGRYFTTISYSLLAKEWRGSDGAKIFKRVWNPIPSRAKFLCSIGN
ncbi:hypothetical protein SLA2020_234830 [Shorea laevis]